jgi:hypothetical protein
MNHPKWNSQTRELSPKELENKLENCRLIKEKVPLYRGKSYNEDHNDYTVEFRLFFKYKDSNGNPCYKPREYIEYNEIGSFHKEEQKIDNIEDDIIFKDLEAKPLTKDKTIYEVLSTRERAVKKVKKLYDKL